MARQSRNGTQRDAFTRTIRAAGRRETRDLY